MPINTPWFQPLISTRNQFKKSKRQKGQGLSAARPRWNFSKKQGTHESRHRGRWKGNSTNLITSYMFCSFFQWLKRIKTTKKKPRKPQRTISLSLSVFFWGGGIFWRASKNKNLRKNKKTRSLCVAWSMNQWFEGVWILSIRVSLCSGHWSWNICGAIKYHVSSNQYWLLICTNIRVYILFFLNHARIALAARLLPDRLLQTLLQIHHVRPQIKSAQRFGATTLLRRAVGDSQI